MRGKLYQKNSAPEWPCEFKRPSAFLVQMRMGSAHSTCCVIENGYSSFTFSDICCFMYVSTYNKISTGKKSKEDFYCFLKIRYFKCCLEPEVENTLEFVRNAESPMGDSDAHYSLRSTRLSPILMVNGNSDENDLIFNFYLRLSFSI